MKTNLTQAITIHSAYGVEVEYSNGSIRTVDPKINGFDFKNRTIGTCVAVSIIEQGLAKLLLHSLDKLTQEIDGKVGIVELAKECWFKVFNYEIDEFSKYDFFCEQDKYGLVAYYDEHRIGFSFINDGGFFYFDFSVDSDMLMTNQLELFNYLLEKGYNVFGLSSEFVKSKS